MSDEYRKGADAAAQDFPHNRLASRAFGQLAKNAFGLLPGSQAREDEFRDGYRDTHRTLSTDQHRTLTTQSKTPGNFNSQPPTAMAQSTQNAGSALSYAAQKALLGELKSYLLAFNDGLRDVDHKYRTQMDALDGVMMREDHNLLVSDHMEPTCSGIRRVQEWIEGGSVPALSAQIAHFGGAADSGGTSHNLEPDLGYTSAYGNERSWQGQAELLYELKAFLGRLEVSLSLFQVNYRQKVAGLADIMLDDHAEFVEHHMEPTVSMIQGLREFIAENSVPTVLRIIEQIDSRPHF